jgi:hypothetical protein
MELNDLMDMKDKLLDVRSKMLDTRLSFGHQGGGAHALKLLRLFE